MALPCSVAQAESHSSPKKKTSVSASSAGPDAESTPGGYPPLLIGPGDELEIYVVNFSSGNGYVSSAAGESGMKSQLPTDYLVDTNGRVLFPFLGEIQLQGLTQIQAGKLLIKELAEFIKYPQVTVLIRSSNNYNVSVLGEVPHPGKYLIRGIPTVLSAISEAGGPLQDANLGGALVIRGDTNKKESLHLDRYLNDRGFQEKPPLLYPGDILMLPKGGGISTGDLAIIASILASAAIIATQIK
jgi:polysaccharide export outer membrane protein